MTGPKNSIRARRKARKAGSGAKGETKSAAKSAELGTKADAKTASEPEFLSRSDLDKADAVMSARSAPKTASQPTKKSAPVVAKDDVAKDDDAKEPSSPDKASDADAGESLVLTQDQNTNPKSGEAPPAHEEQTGGAQISKEQKGEGDAEPKKNYSTTELRRARIKARQLGLDPKSGAEAIRMLEERGVPLEGSLAPPPAIAPNATQGRTQLPAQQPAPPQVPRVMDAAGRQLEIKKLEKKIRARRDRNVRKMLFRFSVFVLLPTLLIGLYYFRYATPLYASNTEMNIENARSASPDASLFSGFGSDGDLIAIQGYLHSRDAYARLEAAFDFDEQFQGEDIDRFRRLPDEASDEERYGNYRRNVKVSYDNTDKILRMEVRGPTQEGAVKVAQLLISFAEERVDDMTKRVRNSGVDEARKQVRIAEDELLATKNYILSLQEEESTLSPQADKEIEIGMVAELRQRKSQLELSLAEIMTNPQPNQTRVRAFRQQIGLLDAQINKIVGEAQELDDRGLSTTRLDQEMRFAEAELIMRQTAYDLAITSLNSAEAQARSQRKFLTPSLDPTASFEPIYPRKYLSTFSAFLIFFCIYVFISMSVEVLREQLAA